jgi:hypothetical protein
VMRVERTMDNRVKQGLIIYAWTATIGWIVLSLLGLIDPAYSIGSGWRILLAVSAGIAYSIATAKRAE